MPTQKQTDANRRNALHSTGPRSASGRARSSMNALKSGLHAQSMILPGESPAEFETLVTEYHDYHDPRSPETRFLCDRLARGEWLSNRLGKIEVKLITYEISTISRPQPDCLLGQAYAGCSKDLSRLQRYMSAIDREYHRDLHMLRLLEAEEDVNHSEPDSPSPNAPVKDDVLPEVPIEVIPTQPEPEPPRPQACPATPEPQFSTSQPTATTTQTPKMASFRQSTMRPGHPDLLQDCPNCRNLGYLNSNCHYVLKKPSL